MKCLVVIYTLAAVAAAYISPFYSSPYGSYYYPTPWRNINPYGGYGIYGVAPVGVYPSNLYPTFRTPAVTPTTVEDKDDLNDYYNEGSTTDTPDYDYYGGSTTDTPEEDDGACPGCCENAFSNHTSVSFEVKCIVYDDANCNSEDWVLTLGDGSKQTLTGRYKNNTESMSIRKGCKLSLFKGENHTGPSVVFPATQGDWHGTLETHPDKYMQTYDDAVNSITCDCN